MMNQYKKITILIIIFMFVSCININASDDNFVPGESGKPAVLISSASGKPGEEVEIDVSIINNPGICTMYLNINYSEGLKMLEASDSGLLIDPVFSENYEVKPYRLTWDDSVNTDNNKNGKIATLKFKIPENPEVGEYKVWITYNPEEIYNMELKNQYFEAGFGKITVDGFVDKSDSTPSKIDTNSNDDNNKTIQIISICCIAAFVIVGIFVIYILKFKK